MDVGEMLGSFLGPEYISIRPGPGGQSLSYLMGHRSISLANGIFGWDGWRSEIKSKEIHSLEQGKDGSWSCVVTLTVRVTASSVGKGDVYHEDVGSGEAERAKGRGAALEKAIKEASTDALKRALRQFGEALGNCLYNKEYRLWAGRLGKAREVHVFDEERLFTMPENGGRKKRKVCSSNGFGGVGGSGMDVKQERGEQDVEVIEEWMEAEFDGDVDDEVDF